jgi:nucleoside-diphosphate-sugar epimerase
MILVTGATGAFGRLVAQELAATAGETLTLCGDPSTTAPGHHAIDLTDAAAVRRLIDRVRPTAVYHLAGAFAGEFGAMLSVNALAARHLFSAFDAAGLRPRVVVIGSAAEYGRVEPHENPVREDRMLAPVSAYGATKALQTHLAGEYAYRGGDVVVARMFNLIAPGLSDRLFVGRVEQQIARFKAGDTADILVGNLDAQRDYVDGAEAVRQLQAIAARGFAGGVYHIASGVPLRMRELLLRMLAEADVDPSVVRENDPAASRGSYDAPVIFADIAKTHAIL